MLGEQIPIRSIPVELLGGDASKTVYTVGTIDPQSGTKEQVVVTGIHVFSVTAAAQIVTLQDATPGVTALKIPASWAAGSQIDFNNMGGIEMTRGQNLIIKPAAAGPAQFWIVDFYVRS